MPVISDEVREAASNLAYVGGDCDRAVYAAHVLANFALSLLDRTPLDLDVLKREFPRPEPQLCDNHEQHGEFDRYIWYCGKLFVTHEVRPESSYTYVETEDTSDGGEITGQPTRLGQLRMLLAAAETTEA